MIDLHAAINALLADYQRLIMRFDSKCGGWQVALLRRRVLYAATGPTMTDALAALVAQAAQYPHGAPWHA